MPCCFAWPCDPARRLYFVRVCAVQSTRMILLSKTRVSWSAQGGISERACAQTISNPEPTTARHSENCFVQSSRPPCDPAAQFVDRAGTDSRRTIWSTVIAQASAADKVPDCHELHRRHSERIPALRALWAGKGWLDNHGSWTKTIRPVSLSRQAEPSPARHLPDARSARLEQRPFHSVADQLKTEVFAPLELLADVRRQRGAYP